MAVAELVRILGETTLATTMAALLVLVLRRPVCVAFGARVAYGMWALVPVSLLAALVPVPAALVWPVSDASLMTYTGAAYGLVEAGSGGARVSWVAGGWLAGVVGFAVWCAMAQVAFRRRIGRLVPRGEFLRAESACDSLPATLGLCRARIVLPADFATRYDRTQRLLVLAHERAHIARGDLRANAVACALRCLFWFNPLAHVAAVRFRHDQELACDAHVLDAHPWSRRSYGDALLHTRLEAHTPPLGCPFGFGHPLKERIAMLKRPVPSSRRRLAGNVLVATIALGLAFTTWASQSQSAASPAMDADGDVRAVDTAAPKYPDGVAKQGVGGKVVLIVDVGADGSVSDVVVEHAEPAGVFDAAALAAAKRWKFAPKTQDGKPVAGRVRVPIWFEPKKPDAAATQS